MTGISFAWSGKTFGPNTRALSLAISDCACQLGSRVDRIDRAASRLAQRAESRPALLGQPNRVPLKCVDSLGCVVCTNCVMWFITEMQLAAMLTGEAAAEHMTGIITQADLPCWHEAKVATDQSV